MYKFKYVGGSLSNFWVQPRDVAIAGASSLLGGGLYGGTYVGTKRLMGEDLNTEQTHREIAGNTAAGTVSGLGGYLLTKALSNRNRVV